MLPLRSTSVLKFLKEFRNGLISAENIFPDLKTNFESHEMCQRKQSSTLSTGSTPNLSFRN